MASAREIVRHLNGDWHGEYGLCPGPNHSANDRSLQLIDGRAGVIIHSYSPTTTWAEARDWLKSLGLLQEGQTPCAPSAATAEIQAQQEAKRNLALGIWREAHGATGTSVERYLKSRGIAGEIPPTLRYHPLLKHTPTGLEFEAMVAAVQSAEGRNIIAIHRTYLTTDGRGKANVSANKMALGALASGAVRLAPAAREMGVAEGIETGLSAMILHGLPVWCALGGRIEAVWFPPETERITIFADGGTPGLDAAMKAKCRFEAQGRRAIIRIPPDGLGDWNDVLKLEMAK